MNTVNNNEVQMVSNECLSFVFFFFLLAQLCTVNTTIAHHLKTLCTTQILFNRGRLLQSKTRRESFLHRLSAVNDISSVFRIGECSEQSAIKGNAIEI